MDNIIKIPSDQSVFDTSGNKQLVDFRIPAGLGTLDLSKSYIAVNLQPRTVSSAQPDAVFMNFTQINASTKEPNLHFPSNAVLVKNASAFSQSAGKLEDLRRVDVLRHNLAYYKKNYEEQNDDIDGINCMNYRQFYKAQNYNEVNAFGDVASRNSNKDVRIPLKDVFNFCRTENYDLSKYGNTKLHFEMNFDKCNVGITFDNGYNNNELRGGGGNGDEFNKMDDQAGVGAAGSKILTSLNAYNDKVDSPFFVGQVVDVAFTGSVSGAGTSVKRRIVKIERNLAGGNYKLLITLDDVFLAQAQDYTGITLGNAANGGDQTNTFTINKCELVAYVNNDPEPQPKLVYSTFIAQEDSYPVALTSHRNYMIPPNTKNVYVIFSKTIHSEEENLDSYRITVDGEQVVNRSIKVGSPIEQDLVSQVFMNNGEAVHDLARLGLDIFGTRGAATDQRSSADNPEIQLIMFPVKYKGVGQILNLELEAAAGQTLRGNHIVYSEVVRER